MSQSQEEKEQAKEQARKELLETMDHRQTFLQQRKIFWEELISQHYMNPFRNQEQEIFWKGTLENYKSELKAIDQAIRDFPAKRARELAILEDPDLLRRERSAKWAAENALVAAQRAAHREKEAAKELQDAQRRDREWDHPEHGWPEDWPNSSESEINDESSEHDSDEEVLLAEFFGDQDTPLQAMLRKARQREDDLVAKQDMEARLMNQEWSTEWQQEQDDKDEELQNAIRASEQDLTRAMSWDPRFLHPHTVEAGAAGGHVARKSSIADEMQIDDSEDDWFPLSSTRHDLP
jgi:hypothetical protein